MTPIKHPRLGPNATFNRSRTNVFLVLSVSMLLASSVSTSAQVCGSSDFLGWMAGKERDSQGLIHATVNYAGGNEGAPTATMLLLMRQAVTEWNFRSCSTGVLFVPWPGGGVPDIEFTYTQTESYTGGCARYNWTQDRIYHGPALQSRLDNLGSTQTKAVFLHELGHFLGL